MQYNTHTYFPFLCHLVLAAVLATIAAGDGIAADDDKTGPLIAYIGTFSSPLKDTLPTQVDLPPGNGRGIHMFRVNR
ncbi:MAG: hypothetical protein KDA84_01150, partial [Planctomycetaceae bacterium]|nr:hypothetical protein [Planctomycetaceae bacterium]